MEFNLEEQLPLTTLSKNDLNMHARMIITDIIWLPYGLDYQYKSNRFTPNGLQPQYFL